MSARFILSLDCEGKWGTADRLTPQLHATLTDRRLQDAYSDVVALLDEFELPATFAFVGAFAETRAGFQHIRPGLESLRARAPHYLGPALDDLSRGSRQGWHGDWAVDSVAGARTQHEIALHGVSHVPWNSVDGDFIKDELALFAQLESPVRQARTFIYPRNLVAHSDLLAGAGILGYRLPPPERSRFRSLLSEFDLFARPEADPPDGTGLCTIPAGFFVNWRHALRRTVPVAVSALRARRLLERAEPKADIVHYWLHPENIASAPATFDLLRRIVEMVARMREAGRCEVLTQLAYCRSR